MKISSIMATACAATVSAVLIVGAPAPTSRAATAIGVNGIGGGVIGNTLRGWVWEGADQQLDLAYQDNPLGIDNSINNGMVALLELMAHTPDVDRLVGLSQSALVITAALREHPEIVPGTGLTVYLIGNPARERTGISVRYEGGYVPIIGLTHKGPIPDGIPGLTVIDVSFEYDGIADSPHPFNLLAVLNAIVGTAVLHPFYGDIDMNDPNLLVRQIGSTTQYLVPVERLPILSPLYGLGLGALANALDPLLRAIIDTAHDRQGYVTLGSLQQSQATQLPGAAAIPESVQASLLGELPEVRHERLTATPPFDQTDAPAQPAASEKVPNVQEPDAGASELAATIEEPIRFASLETIEEASSPPETERITVEGTQVDDKDDTGADKPAKTDDDDHAGNPRDVSGPAAQKQRTPTDTPSSDTSSSSSSSGGSPSADGD